MSQRVTERSLIWKRNKAKAGPFKLQVDKVEGNDSAHDFSVCISDTMLIADRMGNKAAAEFHAEQAVRKIVRDTQRAFEV